MFVPRLPGDALSSLDMPSICWTTPPAHLRYRRPNEGGRRRSIYIEQQMSVEDSESIIEGI